MAQEYYLGFDAGTQSVKVAVYNEKMECVVQTANPTTLVYPAPGWVQMDADEYLQLTKLGIKECITKMQEEGLDPSKIKAVMGDGIICGIVGIDAQGRAITPYINYLDSRTQGDAAELCRQDHSIWGRETGNPEPLCMFPALHARWLLKNNEAFKAAGAKFVHNAPYILMNLAGLAAADAFIDWGTMSGWGLGYNVYKKQWSPEQLELLGIDATYMPQIVKPWDFIGKISAATAAETGCPEGIPICAGAGDTMQSMLGSGVFEANKAVDVAGTCAMFCVSTAGIVPELSQKGSGLIFNSGTLENTYFYWGFVRTGGLALRWFKDNICQQAADAGYYKQLSEQAAAVAPGANDVVFLPYLTGGYEEGSDVRGAFLNMTLDTDQFVLWRAVLEAIAYDYMAITDTYRAAGIGINRITITEGGSRDDLWNQIKADVMQAEAITLEVSGGAVLTNCVIAAYATGAATDLKQVLMDNMKVIRQYQPDSDKADFYRQQSQKQQLLLKKLSC